MTAGAEHRPRSALAVLIVAALLTISACTPDPSPAVTTPAAESSSIPADDEQAIARTIDRFNAAAAGPVAGQQTVLSDLIDPALVGGLDKCPPATATLRFEPIYPGPASGAGVDAADRCARRNRVRVAHLDPDLHRRPDHRDRPDDAPSRRSRR